MHTYIFRWDRGGRKGQECRVTARGKMNSCRVEFSDGFVMITSRNAIRKAQSWEVGQVYVWWSPGEPEDDLHGFRTQRERDDYARGKPGPFQRVVRDHHKLGPIDPAVLAVREITDKWVKR